MGKIQGLRSRTCISVTALVLGATLLASGVCPRLAEELWERGGDAPDQPTLDALSLSLSLSLSLYSSSTAGHTVQYDTDSTREDSTAKRSGCTVPEHGSTAQYSILQRTQAGRRVRRPLTRLGLRPTTLYSTHYTVLALASSSISTSADDESRWRDWYRRGRTVQYMYFKDIQ